MPGFDFKNALDYTRWYAQIRQIKRKALSLFEQAIAAAREAGGPYLDIPDNLAQTWQDSAGTIPAAIGSTVGLLTDRSFGGELGEENWLYGTPFTCPSVGAYGTLAGSYGSPYITLGKSYICVVTVTGLVTPGLSVQVGTFTGAVFNSNGTRTFIAVGVTSTSLVVKEGATAGGSAGAVVSISVRELKGNPATQATAGNRFLLELYNGHPMLRGNGASTSAQFAVNPIGPNLSQPYTIIAGGVVGALGSNRAVYGDNSRFCMVDAFGKLRVYHNAAAGASGQSSMVAGTAFVAEFVWSGGTLSLYLNGASDGTFALVQPTTAPGVGNIGQSGASGLFWNGLLLPVFATNSVVPESQRRQIGRGMAQKLGVTYA